MRAVLTAVVAACLTLPGGAVSAAETEPAPAAPSDHPTGLVIERAPGLTRQETRELVAERAGVSVQDVPGTAVAPGFTAVTFDGLSETDLRELRRQLAADPQVKSVELDRRAVPLALPVPNDPLFGQQWALWEGPDGGQSIRALAAWPQTVGGNVTVAAIDTGRTVHPDVPQTLAGYDFISDVVVANDGDSRDPITADPGDWVSAQDLADHPDLFEGCPVADSSWHGTLVSGLIAAQRDNGVGIAGAAPGVRILPVRAIGKCFGELSDVAAAITWAAGGSVDGVPDNPDPAQVINLSLGSPGQCPVYLQNAIDLARSRGAVVVAAAGNEGQSLAGTAPANCQDVISVAASTRSGARAPYSNVGTAEAPVSLTAPGGHSPQDSSGWILTTSNTGLKAPTAATYDVARGTSMSAPLVSAAAALVVGRYGFGPDAVQAQLERTARAFPGNPAGVPCTPTACGAGLVDAGRAVDDVPVLPGPPSNLQAAVSDRNVFLTWEAPATAGSAPVTDYLVEVRANGGPWQAAYDPWVNDDTFFLIGALNNGDTYEFRVGAHNVFGVGESIQTGPVVPRGLPGAIEVMSAKFVSRTRARVRLALPDSNGVPLTAVQYRVARSVDSWGPWTDAAPAGRLVLNGLSRKRSYFLEVRAVTEAGAGLTALETFGKRFRPSKVRGVRVWRSPGRAAEINWLPPKFIGLRLGYQVRVYPDAGKAKGRWRTVQEAGFVTKPLRKRIYRMDVRALEGRAAGPVTSIRFRR